MAGTIVYIGGFEMPDKNAAAHRVLNNAKILREQGYDVVFIGTDKELAYSTKITDTKLIAQGFTCYAVPYPKSAKQWVDYLVSIDRYIELIELLENVTAVIFYNFQAVAMQKLMNFCKKAGIICIADVTEWRSAKGEKLHYRILKESDTWYRMHVLHKQMNGLIVISSYLQDYYRSVNTTVCIPTLTDISEGKWENLYTKDTECLRLVYAGNPGKKDKIGCLIEALLHVKRKYRLDVIGITLDDYLKIESSHESFLKGNADIVFHGRLPHLDTLEYVKKANYSCFFRDDDRVTKAGFPTKLAEAISCGTPVMTNGTSDLPQYLKSNRNGILLDGIEAGLIANTIEKMPSYMETDRMLFDYHCYANDVKEFLKELIHK